MPYPTRVAEFPDHLFDNLFEDAGESETHVSKQTPEELLAIAQSGETFPLTREQEEFVLDVLSKLGQQVDEPVVLEGPAGTGKTTTLLRLIRAVVEGWGVNAIRVAAFTHKACSVLGATLSTWEEAPAPTTLHSLLYLKPQRAQYGQPETFSQTRTPNLGGVYLLLVDECSMIGVDLFKYIEAARKAHPKLFVVYAGDPNQLQPVGERALSKTFRAGPVHRLTKVLRHDGAILTQATRIRELRHVAQLMPCSGGGSDVVLYESAEALEQAWLDKVVETDAQHDPTSCIMLCYTNDNRRKFNDRARKAIHGPDVPLFMKNDVLVTLSAYTQRDEVVLNNNEDIVVQSAAQQVFNFPNHGTGAAYEGWRLFLRSGLTVPVLNPDQAKLFKKAVRALGKEIKTQVDAAQARRDLRAVQIAKRRWSTEYFHDAAYFAEVDFRYALTIHKSQGSTFQHVFITNDYLKSSAEAKSLLYVAFTRAAKSVHHIDNRLTRS
jgi:exodeoxyribonuclease-5